VEFDPSDPRKKLDHYINDNCEIFTFARVDTKEALAGIGSKIHPTFIEEKYEGNDFPIDAYYPLLEMVTVTLSQYLDPMPMDELSGILSKIKIKPDMQDGFLVFTLLPPAKCYDKQELLKQYARVKELLRAA
jgi:hypothetical protein